ncbi:brain-specific serine protease 4-like isoform X2 [Babylonia areolata]|uniref:brain-specific serine protease 4-like isoform X2 n=1 Tax=Babylonia areolata TaxID=304850 RepID=UPI003FD0F249
MVPWLSSLLVLLLSSLSASGQPDPRFQGQELWNLMRDHYGYQSASYIGFSLQLFSFHNREDLLRRKLEEMKSTGQLHYLCRYVRTETCSRSIDQQNAMFLLVVHTLNEECCIKVTPTAASQGMWGEWGRWTVCSVTCGQGTRSRTRRCDSPPPSGGGQYCAGYGFQLQQCQAAPCRTVVNGMWGGWGGWTSCSVTCGQGTRSRTRRCDSPPPSGGGQYCAGYAVQQTQCQTATCPAGRRECSRSPYPADLGGRIMGGSAALPGQYPWLVHVVIQGTIRCAGVIVDPRQVLTAGHCLEGRVQNNTLFSTDLEVIAGNYNRSLTLEPNAQRVSVTAGVRHYNYDRNYLTNDVAILRLAEPLQFNSVVTNVCLPSKTDRLPGFCVVAGWGALSYSYTFPDQLQHVQLKVYDYRACKETFDPTTNYNISLFLMEGVMCAANGTAGGKDSCRGDSGSGLMCASRDAAGLFYKLYGLVSNGFGCGRQGEPGYYAYIPFYMDWITATITSLNG